MPSQTCEIDKSCGSLVVGGLWLVVGGWWLVESTHKYEYVLSLGRY
jgi:uncharacterized membrane protein YccF (DUF307 family)